MSGRHFQCAVPWMAHAQDDGDRWHTDRWTPVRRTRCAGAWALASSFWNGRTQTPWGRCAPSRWSGLLGTSGCPRTEAWVVSARQLFGSRLARMPKSRPAAPTRNLAASVCRSRTGRARNRRPVGCLQSGRKYVRWVGPRGQGAPWRELGLANVQGVADPALKLPGKNLSNARKSHSRRGLYWRTTITKERRS